MICPNCNGSSFVKHGFVQGVQRWKCRNCSRNVTGKTFSVTYRHRHTTDQVRATVALMMITNASSRNAKTLLELFTGTKISNVTVWEWSTKFKDKLEITSKKYRRVLSGRIWHIDEVFIKVRGSKSRKNFSYLVFVRNQHGTMLAVEVGHKRDTKLIRKAIVKAQKSAKQKPSIVVSDRFIAYPKALKKAFPKERIRDNPKHVYAHGKRGFKAIECAQCNVCRR